MSTNQIIENALLETMKNHPSWINTVPSLLYNNASLVDPIRFSSSNNARNNIKTTESNDFIEYILVEAMKIFGATIYDYNYDRSLSSLSPYDKSKEVIKKYGSYYDVQNAKEIIMNPDINAIAYYRDNINELLALATYVASARFKPEWYPMVGGRYLIDPEHKGEEARREIDEKAPNVDFITEIINKIESDRNKLGYVSNLRFYPETINQCLIDVLNGAQLQNRHNEYALDGTLFASQDVGKRRSNQEDSVVILIHPENPEFKLLAVADGMGGEAKGEYASSETIKYISNWFNSLPVEYNKRPDLLTQEFNKAILTVNNMIADHSKKEHMTCGTTFTGAIRTENDTIIAHVGDSRAYTIKDGQVKLITRDESRVWPYIIAPDGKRYMAEPNDLTEEEIDDLKFRHDSNQIYGYIGDEYLGIPQNYLISNRDYDTLLIMSDGASDLLTMQDIRIASKTTPANYLTQVLVEKALERDAIRPNGPDYNNYDRVHAGKDNTTVAAYVGRRK